MPSEYKTTFEGLPDGSSLGSVISPSPPPGDGWELVGTAAAEQGRVAYTWKRQVPDGVQKLED